ncbi:DUF402 domain-containing protein [Filibacter tadaridae]|uniref:DUF402 domain-containing protein n=1 Tax=Filibacter tadaridae TaxID=2483811 RepID=A0A3P5WXY5_9BACL|nr:DUF402 domain-containing protein [Filibacter tadaridae]VDC28075.1 hypothetical protein FILTAD_01696 [Filibacter tadaridae]
MLKRKYGSRYDWKRVTERTYTELFIDSDPYFKGYVSLLHMKEVSEPLYMTYEGRTVCIADRGYFWMQHFPEGQYYSVTTVFDASGGIVQWYIDISKKIGYCTEHGPWMDDLYLDLIVLPTGKVIDKDLDELETAMKEKVITAHEYELAWSEFKRIKKVLANGVLNLKDITTAHFDQLHRSFDNIERK